MISINDNNDLIIEDQVTNLNSYQYDNEIKLKLKLQLWSAEEVLQRPFRCNLIDTRMQTLRTQ